jgi:hypothetical protein
MNVVASLGGKGMRAITDRYRAEWAVLGQPADELPGVGRRIVLRKHARKRWRLPTRLSQVARQYPAAMVQDNDRRLHNLTHMIRRAGNDTALRLRLLELLEKKRVRIGKLHLTRVG